MQVLGLVFFFFKTFCLSSSSIMGKLTSQQKDFKKVILIAQRFRCITIHPINIEGQD